MAEQPKPLNMTIVPISQLQAVADFILDHRGITAREAQPVLALLETFNAGIEQHAVMVKSISDQALRIAELDAENKMLRESIEALKVPA